MLKRPILWFLIISYVVGFSVLLMWAVPTIGGTEASMRSEWDEMFFIMVCLVPAVLLWLVVAIRRLL